MPPRDEGPEEKPLDPGRVSLTLPKSGKRVVLRPLPWRAFDPLVHAVYRSTAKALSSVAAGSAAENVQVRLDPRYMFAAFTSIIGNPDMYLASSAPECIRVIVGYSLADPEPPPDADGLPDIGGMEWEDVLAVVGKARELNDFKRVRELLKNSWGPVAGDLREALGGGTAATDEAAVEDAAPGPTRTSPST
jgi:hypothetical protein